PESRPRPARGGRSGTGTRVAAGCQPSPADSHMRGQAYYNLGLSFYQEADQKAEAEDHEGAQALFREAADAFRRSLQASPGNRDAGWNLELAQRRIQESEQKQREKEEQEQQEEQERQEQEG